MGFKWNRNQAKKCSPLGEMIADILDDATVEGLKNLTKLAPLLNISDSQEIVIDEDTGAVSVADKS